MLVSRMAETGAEDQKHDGARDREEEIRDTSVGVVWVNAPRRVLAPWLGELRDAEIRARHARMPMPNATVIRQE